jgi:hypothetical protein
MDLNENRKEHLPFKESSSVDPENATEPTYCFCSGISYGDMIKCDNDTVSLKLLFSVKEFGFIFLV